MVFLSAQTWLNKAKEYYTSENEDSEYVIIVQDLAALYKYLAFFDDDDDNQCKLHKRRTDLLEELVKLLSWVSPTPQCWTSK
jgi:KIF-binding protein